MQSSESPGGFKLGLGGRKKAGSSSQFMDPSPSQMRPSASHISDTSPFGSVQGHLSFGASRSTTSGYHSVPRTVTRDQSDASTLNRASHDFSNRFPVDELSDIVMGRNHPHGPSPSATLFLVEGCSLRSVIDDIFSLLQGVDGKYIRFNARKDQYIVDPHITLKPMFNSWVKRTIEPAFMYIRLQKYLDNAASFKGYGLMHQAFVGAIKKASIKYYEILAETQKSEYNDYDMIKNMDLMFFEFRILMKLVDEMGREKGGRLISRLSVASRSGVPQDAKVVERIRDATCVPLKEMLTSWICYGTLQDPAGEFFIHSKEGVDGKWWKEKYQISTDMLPVFLKQDKDKILSTGKSINFVHNFCRKNLDGSSNWHNELNRIQKSLLGMPISWFFDKYAVFKELVSRAHKTVSDMITTVVLREFHLMKDLDILKRFVLLSEGDFGRVFIEYLGPELNKPATKLQSFTMLDKLGTAIHKTTAVNDAKYVEERLDLVLLEASRGETGWDVFSLKYAVSKPLQTIVTDEAFKQYNEMFEFLLKVKRVCHCLSHIWLDMFRSRSAVMAPKEFDVDPVHLVELRRDYHQFLLVAAELRKFTREVEAYFSEVVECEWNRMNVAVGKAKDLDDLILAHDTYLAQCLQRAFIRSRSLDHPIKERNGRKQTELRKALRGSLDSLMDCQKVIRGFSSACDSELEREEKFWADMASTSFDEEARAEEEERKKKFHAKVIQFAHNLTNKHQLCRDRVFKFLRLMAETPDPSLRALSARLDFNRFYQDKCPEYAQALKLSQRSNRMTFMNTADPMSP